MQRSPQLKRESKRESVLHMPLKRLLEGYWVVCDAGNGQMAVQASQRFHFTGRSICTLDWWKGCLFAVIKYTWGNLLSWGWVRMVYYSPINQVVLHCCTYNVHIIMHNPWVHFSRELLWAKSSPFVKNICQLLCWGVIKLHSNCAVS